jgi:hypothetical protein
MIPEPEDTFSMRSSHVVLDQVDVAFDDERIVANAGLLLPATLAERLGLEQATDQLVDLGARPGAARPGRKVLTLVHSLLAGGDSIDDVEVLRAGATASVLGHRVMAASTVGTFLRAFTFGHVRQLDRLAETALTRAWQAGAGPGDGPMTIDADSTICEVYGKAKQGAAYGYTRTLGYHPLLATRADTGEVLHARQRTGKANTARGAPRFVDETIGRVRRARGDRRADLPGRLGVLVGCDDHATTRPWRAVLDHGASDQARPASDRHDRRGRLGRHPYPDSGVAQVAETPFRGDRLVVRRVRNLDDQQQLFPTWRYHAFVTDRVGSAVALDADHRRHAVVELAIRDAKQGSGLNHHPCGKFFANAAWLVLVTLAHNLLRWTATLGLGTRDEQVVAKTLRRTLLALPGRRTRSARRWTLHLPARWRGRTRSPWRSPGCAASPTPAADRHDHPSLT